MASKYGSLAVAKLLLQRRAPPDSAGKVPFQKNGLTNIFKVFIAYHLEKIKLAVRTDEIDG